jgi:hypothetical protein
MVFIYNVFSSIDSIINGAKFKNLNFCRRNSGFLPSNLDEEGIIYLGAFQVESQVVWQRQSLLRPQ